MPEETEEDGQSDWGIAAILFFLLLMAGIIALIPQTTVELGFGASYTYSTYGTIGWTLIGMSWIPFLWPIYKHTFSKMSATYGRAIGEGISEGMRKGKVCPECDTINAIEARFCNECGHRWPAKES